MSCEQLEAPPYQVILQPRYVATLFHRRSGLRSVRAFTAIAILAVTGCDRGPIDATAALPAPGIAVPEFTFPSAGTATPITAATFAGQPAVIALWSVHCPFQGPAMAAFDSLAREFGARGVKFIVLADDRPGPQLDSALAAATWHPVVDAVGVASGALGAHFDKADHAPEREQARVEFVLPSFLLVGPDGRVVRRAFGAPTGVMWSALDSLVGNSRSATITEPAA